MEAPWFMSIKKNPQAEGKRLLMDAALTLTSNNRSLSSLSLRELSREAGLNPNTFYRHFKDFDDLGLTIIAELTDQIRQPLRDLRREAAASVLPLHAVDVSWEENPQLNMKRFMQVNKATIKLFFDFVASNPNAFIVGVRELHGASKVMRHALRNMMSAFAQDMAEDVEMLNLLPGLDKGPLLALSEVISRDTFLLSMDYIELPDQRDNICLQAENLVATLFIGSTVIGGQGALVVGAFED
ncbi:MAG: TetR family transcriptional regulator [Moraxellaceae bacterium]|nr:MAG: TetR family transcriptional regulator [Moraxellaceae bacterium]